MRKSLYVGCALQSVPDSFLNMVEELKRQATEHWEIFSFVGTDPTVTAQTVYETDIAMATQADVMLAICDHPSTGLGIELATRTELQLPTIITHHADNQISRMVLGMASVANDTVHYQTYDVPEDLVQVLNTYQT